MSFDVRMKILCKQCNQEIKNPKKQSFTYDEYYFCLKGDCINQYIENNCNYNDEGEEVQSS